VIGSVLETQVYPRVLNAPEHCISLNAPEHCISLNAPEHCYKLVPPNTLSDRVDLGEALDFE